MGASQVLELNNKNIYILWYSSLDSQILQWIDATGYATTLGNTVLYAENGVEHSMCTHWLVKLKSAEFPLTCRVRTDPGKSCKVLEFKSDIFQAWKVLKSSLGLGKSWKCELDRVTNFFMISEWLLGSEEFRSHLVFSWICENICCCYNMYVRCKVR